MHVVVVYDADPETGQDLRRTLVTRLHRIQNSVWAGEMTRTDWQDLDRALREHAGQGRVQAWLFPSPPQVHRYGDQDDQQSIFL